MKVKTVEQVINEIIIKVEKWSGKKMSDSEKEKWYDWLDDKTMELHQRFTKDTLEMIPKIKFTDGDEDNPKCLSCGCLINDKGECGCHLLSQQSLIC